MIQKLFITLVFLVAINLSHAQSVGTNCGNAPDLPIGFCHGANQTVADQVMEGGTPLLSCRNGGSFKREGWYTFTPTVATDVMVTVSSITASSNLVIQLLSGSCGNNLLEIGCANSDSSISAQTEMVCTNLVSPGIYFIRIVNAGANTNDMDINNVCISTTCGTGITKPVTDNGFTVFPNPAMNTITISVDESMVGNTATLTDVLGKNLATIQLDTRNLNFETSSLANGIYSVNVVYAYGQSITKKLTIAR